MNPSHVFAHFDPASGLVRQFSTTPFALEGLDVARVVRIPAGANGHTHKVDLARVVDCSGGKVCRLVAMPADENPSPPFVTLQGLRETRNAMLSATDGAAPADMPRALRAKWRAYRKALRDLGRHETIEAWAAAWPLRPDGGDDLAGLRRYLGDK